MSPALSMNSNLSGRKGGVRSIFIAGTDTGVGKTIVTGMLARRLIEKGYSVVTQKWVQAGPSSDIDIHLKLMGKRKTDYTRYLRSMSPYWFKFASSPHLASTLEGRTIRIDRIKNSLKDLSGHFDFVLVEGSGGLLVPLTRKMLLIDLVKRLRMPVLLVAENRVGAINHVLLSVEALKARNIKILGVIFNTMSNRVDGRILKDNPDIVRRLTGIEILGEVPYLKS